MFKFLPALFFTLALVLFGFMGGLFVGETKVPPYRFLANGAKTIYYTFKSFSAPPYLGQFQGRDTGIALSDLSGIRFNGTSEAAGQPGTILVGGGLNEYLELCPDDGCIAVEIDREGNVLHAYPYRPDAIFAADMTEGSLYREAVPSDPRLIQRPLGLQRYDNGDLLVTFQSSVDGMFPFAAGAARIDHDGNPVWFRFDYSHHWSTLLDDGLALVPDLAIADGSWRVPVGPNGKNLWLGCRTGHPQVDGIHILDGDGQVVRRIDVAAAILESPWSSMLAETTDSCDPLHINFADILDDSAPGGPFSPGFYVISLRNISALAVIDPATDRITAMMRGNFVQQHSVNYLSGTKVLLFDNWGGDADVGRASRLMEIDLAAGTERRVFPQPGTPEAEAGLFSDRGSHVAISADKTRALVSYSGEGRGYEVDIATGRVLLTYDNLHDISRLEKASSAQKRELSRSNLYGMYYLDN